MPSWTKEAREIYAASLKPQDILFNRYFARPLAALLLVPLRRTALTPNQLTFLGFAVFAGAAVAMMLLPGAEGFLVAVLGMELAYVIDQADGQLARLTQRSSRLGAYLDYLVDELKAQLLVLACSLRLYLHWGEELSLVLGLVGLACVSSATAMTTLVRRPEFAGEEQMPGTQQGAGTRPRGLPGMLVYLLRAALRAVLHYPSWLWLAALLAFVLPVDGAELVLWPYVAVMAMAAGFTALQILRRAWRR